MKSVYSGFDYDRFIYLTKDVPKYDPHKKKGQITKKIREEITSRDQMVCQLCGLVSKYGNPTWDIEGDLEIHHVIPNGPADRGNLITLCKYCHDAVHLVLYRDGKWNHIGSRRY